MIDVEKGLREVENVVQRVQTDAELQRMATPEALKLATTISEIIVRELPGNALIQDVLFASLFVFAIACKSQNVARKNCEEGALMVIRQVYRVAELSDERAIAKQFAIDVAERINEFDKLSEGIKDGTK